jgi:ribosomal protection tetracycline resistance protein
VSRKTLNLGILAHVDAGKTTLTERLLYEAGAIDALGSVDAGTTVTDSLALERQRGITIRSAVASFSLGDVVVNLIDTPGHPDFIAEVERVLAVLDGAILVVSAVEGVQPQTRILMRALQRLRIPTVFFVNKTDRVGADVQRVVRELADRLTPAVAPLAVPSELAELLAEHDEELLAAYVDHGDAIPEPQLREALGDQTRRGLVHPVLAGSAMTGDGVDALRAAVAELLGVPTGDPGASADGVVFKIERDDGEKVAYVRMFAGTIHTRDRVAFGAAEGKVTKLSVFELGSSVQRTSVSAGSVAKVWGLADIRVGDRIGGGVVGRHQFAPPTLESVVVPREPAKGAALRAALAQLAEQDPLIDVRQDAQGTLSVSLYGEVQREVIEATLAADYGLAVSFSEPTPLCIERPRRPGEAVEVIHAPTNPYDATIGLRIDPAPAGSGYAFALDIPRDAVPLHIYKRRELFEEAMAGYVSDALAQGRFGWRVTDCVVTMTHCVHAVADGPPSQRGDTSSTDFRKLTPLVLEQALAAGGTVVCEPVVRARVEVPVAALGAVSAAIARLDAHVATPSVVSDLAVLETVLPVLRAQELQRLLPGLSGGEGVLEPTFAGYRPVPGAQPVRPAPP